jgi:HEAT repeat protein
MMNQRATHVACFITQHSSFSIQPLLRVVVLGVLLLAGPGRAAADGYEEDLTYQARALRDWIRNVRGTNPAARRLASRVLRFVGPEAHQAAPALLMALKTEDAIARLRVAQALARIGPRARPLLAAALGFDNDRICAGAARALLLLGPDARPALRALHRQLRSRNDEVRILSALALCRIDRLATGLPALRKELAGSAGTKREAAWALATLGAEAAPAAGDLVALLADSNDSIREWAMDTLEAIGAPAVPELLRACASPLTRLRVEAAEALGRIGPEADAATTVLVALLKDPSAGPRVAAARALGRIAPEPPAVVSRLRAALGDRDSDLQLESARALAALGARSTDAVAELRLAARSSSRPVRRAALGALVRLGKPAVPALVELLADEDHLVRRQALLALRDLGPEAAAAVPALQTALADPTVALRSLAVDALAAIGPPAVPALAAALSQEGDVRRCAALALARIGRPATAASKALADALRDPSPEVRPAVLGALAALGPDALPAVPALVKLFDQEAASRGQVLSALVRIGPEARIALAVCSKALADNRAAVRLQALAELASLGAKAKPVTEKIVGRLKDDHLEVRRAAALTLILLGEAKPVLAAAEEGVKSASAGQRETALWMAGALGVAAKGLLPLVRERGRDENPAVRLMAVWALAEIDRLDGTALSVLQKLLQDRPALPGRPAVFRLLGQMGSEVKPAVAALQELVAKEADLALRIEAARTLAEIGPDAAAAAPALLALLLDIPRLLDVERDAIADALSFSRPADARFTALDAVHDADLQREAEQALLRVRRFGLREMPRVDVLLAEARHLLEEEVLSALSRMGAAVEPLARAGLASEGWEERSAAARALGRLGGGCKRVSDLRRALKDPWPAVRIEAAAALSAVAAQREGLIDVLAAGLQADGETPVRAAGVLAGIGPAARRAAPALAKALRCRDARLRIASVRALGQIHPEDEVARSALRERLRDALPLVRVEAARALGRIDATFDPVPVLLATLREARSWRERLACIDGLSHLADVSPALPYLFPLLSDETDRVRAAAAGLLWKSTKDRRAVLEVLPAIAAGAHTPSPLRLSALRTLAELGADARPALPVLSGIVRDPAAPREVRLRAREVLAALDK